jgi:hypothetical protein
MGVKSTRHDDGLFETVRSRVSGDDILHFMEKFKASYNRNLQARENWVDGLADSCDAFIREFSQREELSNVEAAQLRDAKEIRRLIDDVRGLMERAGLTPTELLAVFDIGVLVGFERARTGSRHVKHARKAIKNLSTGRGQPWGGKKATEQRHEAWITTAQEMKNRHPDWSANRIAGALVRLYGKSDSAKPEFWNEQTAAAYRQSGIYQVIRKKV